MLVAASRVMERRGVWSRLFYWPETSAGKWDLPVLGRWDIDPEVKAMFKVTNMTNGVYAETFCNTCLKIIESENETKTPGKQVSKMAAQSTWLLPLQLVEPRKKSTTFELLPYPLNMRDRKKMKATIINRWGLPKDIDLKLRGWTQ